MNAGLFNTSVEFERDIKTPAPDAGFVTPPSQHRAGDREPRTAFAVEVPIQVSLSATAQLGALGAPINVSIDDSFGDTARLTITLPDGYTFTSEGGVFLRDQCAPGIADTSAASASLSLFAAAAVSVLFARRRLRGVVVHMIEHRAPNFA